MFREERLLPRILQARLPVIQLVLDLPQQLVVDAAILAQPDGGLPPGAHDLERDVPKRRLSSDSSLPTLAMRRR